LRDRLGSGRKGLIFSHCRSVSSLLAMATPFACQVDHKSFAGATLVDTRF
jgi:hypothetical protein